MSKSVEMYREIGKKGDIGKYLFFGDTLIISEHSAEGHKAILESSGRAREDIQVAGGFSVVLDDQIVIHGGGSGDLKFPSTDPTPVVEFVRGFPDAAGKLIMKGA
ncbi:MAG: hypothetical protein UU25_C0017G0002 [Microgenomates group bacterium GW2011_GWB1_40_9]|nr:MAG: hypothetical protein UU25_C0017G0002 [Microgenomates group bacterium GW2011_GWB1_40_9]